MPKVGIIFKLVCPRWASFSNFKLAGHIQKRKYKNNCRGKMNIFLCSFLFYLVGPIIAVALSTSKKIFCAYSGSYKNAPGDGLGQIVLPDG